MSYTPGPWEMMRCRKRWEITGPETFIGDVYRYDDDGNFDEGVEADARLIAAAPDLLKALKELVQNVRIHEEVNGHAAAYLANAYIAIAKAEGKVTDSGDRE